MMARPTTDIDTVSVVIREYATSDGRTLLIDKAAFSGFDEDLDADAEDRATDFTYAAICQNWHLSPNQVRLDDERADVSEIGSASILQIYDDEHLMPIGYVRKLVTYKAAAVAWVEAA